MWLSCYFNFERKYEVKESMHFVEKNISFNKNKTESSMENPGTTPKNKFL